MGYQYRCKDENRHRKYASGQAPGNLYAIDYLEVLDKEAPEGTPRQQTLLVRSFKAFPSETLQGDALVYDDNVEIEGGVRVTAINVVWARRASDVGDLVDLSSIIPEEEQDFFLVVRTDSAGDFSTYCLCLVPSEKWPLKNDQGERIEELDPILSCVEFSFKAECSNEFDCAQKPVCPVERLPEPVIDYMAKDYASFRRLLLDRLSVIMPEWKERNVADLGITLTELLAYAADYLSYYQDAVANEAYLGTARKRISMRRHARLLDYQMHDGCNARAWVCFEVDPRADGYKVVQGSQLATQTGAGTVVSENEWPEIRQAHQPEIFELMHDIRLYSANNKPAENDKPGGMEFYTWGDEECCLPKGATRATLKDDLSNRLRLRAGDVLILEEIYDPVTGGDGDPAHRHAVRLTKVNPEAKLKPNGHRTLDGVDPLYDPLPQLPPPDDTKQAIVEIEWHEDDALPFPLWINTNNGTKPVSVARGNVAMVDHGETIDEELPATTDPDWPPHLKRTGVTFSATYEDYDERTQQWLPAADAMKQDPRQALPAVKLKTDAETWLPQRDLLNSSSFATEFVVEMESDGRAWLRHGDGIYGKTPEGKFKATYRIGNGTAGNIGAEAIGHLVAAIDGINRVWNPLPAQGGVEPETIEEVRLNAPQAFRTQERAVTEEDYAKVVQRHPEVQKAIGTRRWTGSWHTMFVTIDRIAGREVDAEFEQEITEFLEKYRLAGQDVEIDAPRFVPLKIVGTVCVAPGYYRSDVKQALLETFSNTETTDGRKGFFHPDNFTFGQPLYLSRVIAAAMDVPGVRWVDFDDFMRWGYTAAGELEEGVLEVGRLEIIRLDNDPNAPENGKIDFVMEGGL